MVTAARRITILGATGSIGASTLAVIAERPDDFDVVAVTGYENAAKLAEIAKSVRAEVAVVANPAAYGTLREALAGTGIEATTGDAAVADAARRPADLVIAAIVGAAGLAPTMAAIEAGTQVALANKECLVCAGDLFLSAARRAGSPILPVDSEHNAIFQALGGHPIETVEKIILTASGGPFREWSVEAMAAATPQQALRHPNWTMGQKITIDSATMMNKGLEVIEAYHLFGLGLEQVDVLVHPQSAVHGIVAFRDGSMLAQMGAADMRTPIGHCLSWPERKASGSTRLDLAALGTLSFERPDLRRFPALRVAREALAAGGWATNILNAANEIAVEAFLQCRIGFLEIAGLVEETVSRAAGLATEAPNSTAAALDLDREGRKIALELMKHRSGFGIAS